MSLVAARATAAAANNGKSWCPSKSDPVPLWGCRVFLLYTRALCRQSILMNIKGVTFGEPLAVESTDRVYKRCLKIKQRYLTLRLSGD